VCGAGATALLQPRGAFGGDAKAAPCFGGEPQVAMVNLSDPQELVFTDGKLYWWGAGLRRFDPKTGKVEPIEDRLFHGQIIEIGPIDARDVFARTGQDDIVAFDLRTRRWRTLFAGDLPNLGSAPHVADFSGLDRNYLYFAQASLGMNSSGVGFYRIPRDRDFHAQYLATEPYASSSFAIDGGFVYYFDVAAKAVARRALQPGARTQVLAALVATSRRWRHIPRVVVAGGRVYYPYDWAIWSVGVNGGAPVRHAEVGPDGAVDMLAQGRCLYWATDRDIKRIAVDGRTPRQPEVIADARHYQRASSANHFVRVLATDGRHLFWPDVAGDRIMRAAADVAHVAPAPKSVAVDAGGGVALIDPPPPPGASWIPSCGINRSCTTPAANLPPCDADGGSAESWSQLQARADTLIGKSIRVAGPLILGERSRNRGSKPIPSHNLVARSTRCEPGECCRHDPWRAAIDGGERILELESLECAGDDSRLCCNVPAFGQEVSASGILRQHNGTGWLLSSPQLCIQRAP
jgi:hypothetical protein